MKESLRIESEVLSLKSKPRRRIKTANRRFENVKKTKHEEMVDQIIARAYRSDLTQLVMESTHEQATP